MKTYFLIFVCFFSFLCGFKQAPEPSQVVSKSKAQPAEISALPEATPLGYEATNTRLVEHPAQALSVWRQFRTSRPTLVILSQEPFLQPIPDALHDATSKLVQQGTDEALSEKTSLSNPDPLLLPSMAISSALQSSLFAKLVWVFPSTVPSDQLDIDMFRQQLLDYGAINQQEAESLTRVEGGFSGSVRGVPFQATPMTSLPDLEGPIVLHIDLGYFKPLYKGEIKTRLYPLLYQTCSSLQRKGWQTVATTISYSNVGGTLPLAVRFIGPTLVDLFANPGILDKPLPLNWQRRAKALNLPNFFQTEEERNQYLEMQADLPEDPSVKFALYQVSRKLKNGSKALDYLKQAVKLDPGYASEYLTLASDAENKNLADQSVKMLLLASQAKPEDPFIALKLATRLNLLGQADKANLLVKELQQLPWSSVYYPAMPETLSKFSESIKNTAEQ